MFEQERHRAADQSLGCRREHQWRADGQIDDRLGGCTFEKGYTLEKGYILEKGHTLERDHSLEEESYIVHSPPPRRSEPKSPQSRL
jgi:hypothetical protein